MDQEEYENENDTLMFNSSDFFEHEPISREIEKYVVPLLIVFVAVTGIVGNGTLVYILRKKCPNTAENIYILNLAAADLVVLLIFIPFTEWYSIFTTTYPFGYVVCTMTASIYDIALGVSAFTLIAMSAHSMINGGVTEGSYRSQISKRNALIAVAVIWVLAIAAAVPTMLFARVYETYGMNNEEIKLCLSTDPELITSIEPFNLVVYFLVPVTATAVFLVVARFNKRSRVRTGEEKEFSVSVFALFGVFVLLFLPPNLFTLRNLVFSFDYSQLWHSVSVLAYCLAFVYRCANPVVLYWTSDTFRELFNRYLFCCCTQKSREREHESEVPLQSTA